MSAAVATSPAAVAITAAEAELPQRLGNLGLSPDQVTAVLALSREVIERVVWEVVPELAETLIKEEIRRLTSS
jgi:predicted N-formylglutamate amidohydrolase